MIPFLTLLMRHFFRMELSSLFYPLLLALLVAKVNAADTDIYSPYVNRNFPENVYWGDTHLHSAVSADAYSLGDRLGLDDAYRFARGEQVISTTGQPTRLPRPLDFLVIADHAEYLGIYQLLNEENPALLSDEQGKTFLREYQESGVLRIMARFSRDVLGGEFYREAMERVYNGEDIGPQINSEAKYPGTAEELVWKRSTEKAEQYNDPGKFTSLIGFEWTSMPEGNNLHRVVIFRDGADKAQRIVPFTAGDSLNPEDLWRYLEDYEKQTGGEALAIPHNGNVSGGLMFADKTFGGEPFTAEYAANRARWEPLYEMTQMKGDAETHPILSPEDLFADYESWDEFNLASVPQPQTVDRLAGEYARSALRKGLLRESQLGVNPFKFGMIGSTDSHTSLSTVDENNFFSKEPHVEPSPERASNDESIFLGSTYAASGRAAVWAQENTRESIFDAMQRRETYATTGPRIVLRFFGGWNFDQLDADRPDYAAIGYDKGVPMGADLTAAPAGKSPRFLIVAAKDPLGANLERVQVVKGWLDSEGETREQVWDVVLSDKRKPGKMMAPPIASTVDIKTATYTNTVGEAEMATVWEDPEFDPQQRAFYYVRVLEIPTPRWTTYDAAFYGTALPEDVPAIQQERAYSSPIWYTP